MNRSLALAILAIAALLPLSGCGTGSLLSSLGTSTHDATYEGQFALIDADRDQRISFDDTRAWLAREFTAADADKNGFLTDGEIPAAFLTGGRDGKAFLSGYDTNADRKLSLDELNVHVNVLFQRDQDADGQLTLAEVNSRPKRGGGPDPVSNAKPGSNSAGGVGVPN